jgi:transposase-like protein
MATTQNTGIISNAMTPDQSSLAGSLGMQFTDYNGQQVRTDDAYKQTLADSASKLGMSAQDYDKMLNPSTYGARWGIPASTQSSTTSGSPATPSVNTTQQTPVQPSPTASTYTPTQLGDPTKWNVTPQQTAAGLINQYTDPNSPIIQAAMTRAKEAQNANGTLNSSMAETAGQLAAYQAAIPLAQQDAGTYAKAAGYNADEANQFAVQNAGFTNAAGQFNANAQNTLAGQQLSADTQKFVSNLSAETQKAIAGMDNQTKMALANIDSQTKTQLEQIDSQNRQLIQTNSSAKDMFTAYMNSIANIAASTTMDQAAKQKATDAAIMNLNEGLQVLQGISNVDLSKYFPPTTFGQSTNKQDDKQDDKQQKNSATDNSNPLVPPSGWAVPPSWWTGPNGQNNQAF